MRQRAVRSMICLAASGVLAVVPQGARGQEASDPLYELGEVVISAKRDAGVETISTVQTITAEELRASGARSLDEAIRLLPGLHVRIGGSGTPRVDIRGFRTRHVQLLVDGIPINDTYDGQFDPTTIPVEQISRIKLTTGGGSVLYGPGGNGGVINIITRQGSEGLGGLAAGRLAEGGAYQGTAVVSGGTAKWAVFASGNFRDRDEYPLADSFHETSAESGGARHNSDLRRGNVFASARYSLSPRTRLGLTVNRLHGQNGVPPVSNYDKSDPFSQKAKYDRIDDMDGHGAQAAFSHVADGQLTFRGWAYLNRLEVVEDRYDDATYSTQAAKGSSSARSATHVAGASLQVKRALGQSGVATLGLMGESDDWESVGFLMGKGGAQDDFDVAQDLRLYSAALQYEAWPAQEVGVVLGGAYHAQDGEEMERDFSCLVGGWYDLSTGTRLRASLARKVRFPSIRQLYDVSAGNPGLHPERTLHYELGLEQDVAGGVVSMTAYSVDALDFIEKDATELYQNFEEYRFRGVELAAEKQLAVAGGLHFRGSYAFMDTEDRSPGSAGEDLQYRPRHKIGLEGAGQLSMGLMPYLSLTHVAGQRFYDRNGEPPLDAKALSHYTLVVARLRQRLPGDSVELEFGVDNLLDEDYEQSYGLPQAGRVLYSGMRLSF
jgi:vitamin B12 transporter